MPRDSSPDLADAHTAETSPAADTITTVAPPAVDANLSIAAAELSRRVGRELRPGDRYQLGAVIGRGGMGEVVIARDRDLERDVALKRLRTFEPSTQAVARFLREARVQGRLDHPAIVPIHELGVDGNGRPFFTMKRLAGTTLAAFAVAGGDVRRMLRAFVDVCLAIEFAHVHGVIHRDIKPTNIMLGDFGEVYVLDWGVAHLVDADDDVGSGDVTDVESGSGSVTEPGAVLGTPAYMAPEQRRGDDVGPAADVFSLGCVLYEILAGATLQPRRGEPPAPLDARPSARGRDVAPELEAACVMATNADPQARPRARALGEAVQRYLDGDRDAERRRTLAAEHVAAARRALDASDDDARALAMREAGRALALDPTSADAAHIVGRLLLEPPRHPPAEVRRLLADRDREIVSAQGVSAARSLAPFMIAFPILMWLFKHSWPLTAAAFAVPAASVIHALVTSRQHRLFHRVDVIFLLASNAVMLSLLSRMFGCYFVVPAWALALMLGLSLLPRLLDAFHRVYLVFAVSLALPAALEALGVWDRTTRFGRGIVVGPDGLDLNRGVEAVVLAVVLILLYAAGRYVNDVGVSNRAAHERLELQAWHLRQLIPPAG